jgi:hypothetical protein
MARSSSRNAGGVVPGATRGERQAQASNRFAASLANLALPLSFGDDLLRYRQFCFALTAFM